MQVLQPSQRLGDFQIVRLLGKGGMGQVYEAQQLNPPRPVALKVLAPWLAEDAEALERFWREAAVPARLDHPGIVRIIATGKTEDGTAFYVMHLVQGISLADLIQLSRETRTEVADMATTPSGQPVKALPPRPSGEAPAAALAAYRGDRSRFAARFGAVAARALAHAHDKGFLHRDIKPSNLMVDHHDQLYLVDFGLTRALDPGATRTRPGAVHGTPWYMSPEQARGEPLDERSDIYSLGVTLYELITQGEGPFTASRENSAAVMAQVRAGQCLPLRTLAPDVPRKLEQAILRAMHFRPQRRYQSAAALAEDLEEIAGASSSRPGGSQSQRTARRSFRKLVWVGGAMLVLLILSASAYLWLRSSSDPGGGGGDAPPSQGAPPVATLSDFFRRDRPVNVRTPLLRADHQPIRARILWGEGHYHPIRASELAIQSPPDNKPTMIGLDYPGSGSFEFAIELRQADIRSKNENDLGVFFGWHDRAADPVAVQRCFTVQLDERPILKDLQGRVTIGTAQWAERQGARGGMGQFLSPLPQGRGMLPLPKSAAGPGGWHNLRVRVMEDRIRVTADDGPFEEFEVAWLLRADRKLTNASLGPRGALGIWVRNGVGAFRNATIMALPAGP